jgi:hypothetical protein
MLPPLGNLRDREAAAFVTKVKVSRESPLSDAW